SRTMILALTCTTAVLIVSKEFLAELTSRPSTSAVSVAIMPALSLTTSCVSLSRWRLGRTRCSQIPNSDPTKMIPALIRPAVRELMGRASLEEDALDELRNDGRDLDLDIPFLSGVPRMDRHVLERELNLDGKAAQLHHLADADADRHRPDVPGRRLPVREDVPGVPDVPAAAEEDRRDPLA